LSQGKPSLLAQQHFVPWQVSDLFDLHLCWRFLYCSGWFREGVHFGSFEPLILISKTN